MNLGRILGWLRIFGWNWEIYRSGDYVILRTHIHNDRTNENEGTVTWN